MMEWMPFVIINTLIGASNSIIDKLLLNGKMMNPTICAFSFGIVGLPFSVVGLILLSPIPVIQAGMSFAGGLLFAAAVYRYYILVSEEEISRLVPLFRITTIETMILSAILFGETLQLHKYIAFFLLVVASIIFSLNNTFAKNRLT